MIRGPAGSGRSRVAAWVGQRAAELGIATCTRAELGPAGGWVRALGRSMGCVGLTGPALLARIAHACASRGSDDAGEHAALTALFEEEFARGDTTGRRYLVRDRVRLGGRLVELLARERPLVLVLDDAERFPEGIELAAHLLERTPPVPVLVILTVEQDLTVIRPALGARLAELPHVAQVELAPLRSDALDTLLRDYVGLAPALVSAVADRTGGQPAFALDLVGDWIERGLLRPSAAGLSVRTTALEHLPSSVRQLWGRRLRRLAADLGEVSPRALEVAAVLGRTVVTDEWLSVCERVGLAVDAGLLEVWATRGLVRPEPDGFSVLQAPVVQLLLEQAEAADRLAGLHQAAADALLELGFWDRNAERVARHLTSAGALEAAHPHFLAAGEACVIAERFEDGHQLLDEHQSLLDTLGDQGQRRMALDLLRARLWRRAGNYPHALGLLSAIESRARSEGWTELLADLLCVRAGIARQQHRLDESKALLLEARGLYEALPEAPKLADCLHDLGIVAQRQGELGDAATLQRLALARYGPEDPYGRAMCCISLAELAQKAGRLDEAAAGFSQGIDLLERAGNRYGVAYALNGLGELDRRRGELSEARDRYERSAVVFRELGSPQELIPRLNLGYLYVIAGHLERAEAEAAHLLPRLAELGWSIHLGYAHALALAVVAGVRGSTWRGHLAEVRARTAGAADPDLVEVLQLAAAAATAVGLERRSEVIGELAEEVRQSLDVT